MEMLLLLGTILLFFNTAGAQKDYFVVAPNMFRFGVDETVTVSMHDIQGTADVEIYLQDAPGRGFTFSKRVLKVQNDKPVTTTVRVNPSDIPDVIVNDPRAKIYVYLVAICKSRQLSFTKEALILVSPHNGYVFIQTDKPIYTPLQEVRIRIIPLNQDLTLMTSPFRVQIVNPQNITVKRFEYKRGNENGIITEIYKFPRYTLEGIWGVSVEHGYEMSTTTYVPFEVKKYVLPTFDVKIKLNEGTIMESKADIEGTVTARYVYDKPVKGALRLRYGVKTSTGDVSYIPDEKKVEVKTINGRTSFKIPLKLVAQKFKGFPEGHKFHVEATVVEGVSGKEFMVVDESTYFQKSPYLINFKKTVSNFKIGLIVYVQAQVTYSTKTPAVGVDVVFTAITADGTKLNIPNNKRRTDKQGHVQVKLSVPNTSKLTINAVTQDNGLQKDQQGIGKFVMTPYNPGKQAYLGIKPLPASVKLQRGQQFDGTVIIQPWKEINRVVFRVIGRGKVLAAGKTATKKGKNTLEGTFTFKVTDEMIPSVRVVVLANYQNHLIADSLWMDVEDTCQHDTDTTITPNIPLLQPGRTGKVAVHAEKQSTVGIMAVDKAVYVLRNEGQLTSEKVYDTMEGYDVGCGAGGGRDSSNLLEKVGMIVLTSSTATKNEKRDYLRCNDLSRPKRQLEEQSSKWDSDPFIKACCEMGQKPSTFLATCEVRAGVLKVMLAEKYPSKLLCADAFLECCNAYTSVARSAGVEQLDFVTDLNAKESQTLTRTFFPESWLYKEIQMGGATDEEIVVTLPHSITTWVFQAVSVSKVRGICVADPKELVIHQNVFLDVNLPYSVVRNEEIELKVTIFNYLPQTLPVTVYMYGVKGICTGAEEGKKTKKRQIFVPKNSATSTGFFIIPLKIGNFKLRFVALSEINSDVVEKTLKVRAEGVMQFKDRSEVLDPGNYNGRPGSTVWIPKPDGYSFFLDAQNKKLLLTLPVIPPVNSIADTESATINIIGDSFGPTVKTALSKNELGKFFNKPRGCGEQNMMLMAPCLYTMKYLAATGKLGAKEEKQGYDWIREGYQRQLTYRKGDGSYGAWINRASSVWLTAFVMKCFCQADAFINIDESVTCVGIKWLMNRQHKDGYFKESLPVVHTEMTGGNNGIFTMTAFALIGFAECNKCKINGLNAAKAKAINYLENNIEKKRRPYELTMAAYALTLVNSPKHQKAIELMKAASIYNNELDERHWQKGAGALTVEATSYALLTLALKNDLPYAKAVVTWLNANRGFGGVWKSTQDTVVALQALSEYSIKARQPKINLAINITTETDRTFFHSMYIDNSNYQDLQSVDIARPGGLVFIDAYGDGIAQLSLRLRYNTPVLSQDACKFNLKVTSKEVEEVIIPKVLAGIADDGLNVLPKDVQRTVGVKRQGGKEILNKLNEDDANERNRAAKKKPGSKTVLKIKVCTSFKGKEKETSMSIIDIGIFTGYSIIEGDLEKLTKEPNSLIQQYEFSSRGVVLYLDKITHKELCVEIRALQTFRVGSAQRASVTVYDYYKPEHTCTALYSPGADSVIKKSLCSGDKACICPRGGCSACNAFDDVIKLSGNQYPKMTRELLHQACDEHDYVWLVTITNIRVENDFKLVDVEINEILKQGVEGTDQQLGRGSVRTLITYKHCDCPKFELDSKYYIMGQDGTKWENQGQAQYRYLLNPSARVYKFLKLRDTPAKYRLLMKAFYYLERRFVKYKRGCGQ